MQGSKAIATLVIRFFDDVHQIAHALNNIADLLKNDTIRVKDVDRAKVYSEHLGEKLRKDESV